MLPSRNRGYVSLAQDKMVARGESERGAVEKGSKRGLGDREGKVKRVDSRSGAARGKLQH